MSSSSAGTMPPTRPMQLSADEFECLKLLREHHVDAPKLKKLLDLNVNQADAILIEYERTKKMPAQLVKAFLNGVFSGTVAHSNEIAQRASQIPPLQALLKNSGDGVGQTDPRFITDVYLGKGKGIQSRLTSIEKLKSNAEVNLKMLQDVLHERAPEMLESVADDIKKTGIKYTELFCKLDKDVMREVSNLISDLNENRPVGDNAKALQPNSKHYPHLKNPRHPLFMIPLLKDAQEAKKRLDEFVKDNVKGVNGADPKSAPLKSVERALVKVCEKYNGQFDMLTDLARGTIVCQNGDVLRTVLIKLKNAVSSGIARILRIKFRLDDQYDAMEAGGYRDILMNLTFPPNDHIVELQINLEEFVNIKNGGGHASYTVGRMLQVFDSDATTYTGILNSDKARDIQTGLVKKATAFGIDGDETEGKMVEALRSHSVQLIELHLMSVKFNSVLGNLKWLEMSAEHLGGTLTDLCIKKCEVKGPIPPQVGLLLQLVKLNLSDNQLEGTIHPEIFKLIKLQVLNLFGNRLTGPIPPEIVKLANLKMLALGANQLTGPIPTEIVKLTQLQELWLKSNKLIGPIPTEIGKLTELEKLYLHENKLTGPIPPEIVKLTSLQELFLNENQLTGPIPPDIGKLTNLQKLFLNRNQLTGR